MAKIAILGFGTVGSGVYEVLCRNAAGVSRRAGEPVEVKYILDPKDFSNHPDAHLFIKNFCICCVNTLVIFLIITYIGSIIGKDNILIPFFFFLLKICLILLIGIQLFRLLL